MSRVGKKLIPIPSGVKIKIDNKDANIQGPLGILDYKLPNGIKAELRDQHIEVTRSSEERSQRSLHGLARSLLSNMVLGVSQGFSKILILDGVGYRAQAKGNQLTLNLGYSHPVEYNVPDSITIKVEKNKITLKGIDKQLVGQVAAIIRDFRKVEPYKGKGIRYEKEVVRRKVGKVGT